MSFDLQPGDLFDISIVLFCIVLAGIFAAAERALAWLTPARTQQLLSQSSTTSKPLELWLNFPTRIETTILIYRNVAKIIAAVFCTMIALRHSAYGAIDAASTAGITVTSLSLLVLAFSEVLPKALARAHQDVLASPLLRFVHVFYVLIYPLVWGVSELASKILQLFGGKDGEHPSITEEELEFLINFGEQTGVLEETKKDMIVSALEFDETKVREIMTPRPDIQHLETDSSFEEALNLAIESGMSRLPVCDDNGIDHVVGILLVKDLLRVIRSGPQAVKAFSIKKIMREPFFVPESKPIADVFKELKSSKNHIAIVIDEHGGTAGLVTMEDILEEIVGEIQDEYDREEAELLELEPGIYDVSGAYNIDEFLEFFDIEESSLPEEPAEDVDTIAGWITHMVGDIPEVGKTVRIGPLNVEVADVQKRRVRRVRVSKIIDAGDAVENLD